MLRRKEKKCERKPERGIERFVYAVKDSPQSPYCCCASGRLCHNKNHEPVNYFKEGDSVGSIDRIIFNKHEAKKRRDQYVIIYYRI